MSSSSNSQKNILSPRGEQLMKTSSVSVSAKEVMSTSRQASDESGKWSPMEGYVRVPGGEVGGF